MAAVQAPAPPPAYGPPITLERAKKVMAGAEAESRKNSWGTVIVILDAGGNVVMLQRLDGAQLGSIEAARDKAWSAVASVGPPRRSRTRSPRAGPTSASCASPARARSSAVSRSWPTARSSAPSGSRAAPRRRTGTWRRRGSTRWS